MNWEVITGDCLIEMPKLIERGVTVEACIADIPYGTTACKWDSVIPFAPMWANLKKLVGKDRAIVLFGAQPFTSALIMSNPEMFKYEWIWKKSHATGQLNLNVRPMNEHDNVLVFGEGRITYNPQFTPKPADKIRAATRMGESDCYGAQREYERTIPLEMRTPTTVLNFGSPNHGERGIHPTLKPVELMRYLIRTYTNEGDTILDFTCGSGSTGVAAVIERRNFIGIERDEHYAEIARARIKRASGVACDIPRVIKNDSPLPLFALNEDTQASEVESG